MMMVDAGVWLRFGLVTANHWVRRVWARLGGPRG